GRATHDTHLVRELDAALALWRGRPYPELDHPLATTEAARLTELKLTAEEGRAEALLAMGRADDAVAAAESLVMQEPLRERPVGLLMRALVAAGRQSDALHAFTRLRKALAEQLGIDPSPELRRLEDQVLRQELDAPALPLARSPT